MHEAGFYDKQDLKRVKCLLCPHFCRIDEGARGKCKARININGTLYSEGYGLATSLSIDPMEKKPIYHFFPGREILSVGTAGCNFSCSFCQNHQISQSAPSDIPGLHYTQPELIVNNAEKSSSCAGIAYTYNEPTIWYEYMYDIAINAVDRNLKNVVVSNGYINSRPLDKLLEVIHAFNIDLKSFSDKFYRDVSGGTLAPVKRTMEAIRKKGLHLEITHLVVPGLNDNADQFREMVAWIEGEIGSSAVLHISRYFPAWRMNCPPTDVSVIDDLYTIAKEKLTYVYTGNMPPGSTGNDTECGQCRSLVIKRAGYRTTLPGLDCYGNCNVCGESIAVMS